MQCATCGTINPAQARFCMGCGSALVQGIVCGQCQTLLPLQARYCYHCGAFQAQPGTAFQPGAASPQWAVPVQTAPAVTPLPPLATPQAPLPAAPVAAAAPAPATAPAAPAPAAASQHQIGQLPTPRPLADMLPSLEQYLPKDLYEPLEAVPTPRDLEAVRDHLSPLLDTIKTYLPWPVVSAPQLPGIPAGGMYRGVFLFGDVSGFTPLSEKLKFLGQEGAEIITRLINALFTDLVTVLFDHGGTLLKFGGDAMLGLFPASTDEELAAGALRAAQAALAMQEVLKKEMFAQIHVMDEVRSLQIKCGISCGSYFAAHIGTRPSANNPNGTMAYVTTGETVNLAEEAEGHANPGEVAMFRSVHDLLGERAEYAPVTREPDEEFFRLVSVPPLEGASTRLEIQEPPAGEVMAQITYLTERLDRLTPYLSDELVRRIVTNPKNAKIAPENRPVTVMFANYKGVARLIEKMGRVDPDLITHHLNNYFVHMASIIERYEGTLARMDQYAVGDRLVIFFGAPRAHEDDPVRAVTTALEMQAAAVENFSALRTSQGVMRFEQRIGINTGFLFAGNAGAQDLRQEYTLMGDDINMAARLMSKATWGDIYISKRTKEQVEAYFDLEDMGELKVKGKEIRIPTFKVLGKRGELGRTRGFEEGESPLTGRDDQLARLKKIGLDFMKNRRGQIVTLIGNSGLGKSRLLREAKARLVTAPLVSQEQAEQMRWIEVRAFSFSEQMSYWMAAQIITLLLETRTNASPDDVLYALSERCEALLGQDAMNATPYLAHMMGLDLGEEWAYVKAIDPKVRQKQTFRAAAQFFQAIAKERPLLVALDDLHWADEASLALIEHLLATTDKAPLSFLLIFRPRTDKLCWQLRDRAAANYPHRFQEIELEPLNPAMSAELLEKLLPGAIFQTEQRQDILGKAAGNPFYLEEVVRSLRESGAVERVGDSVTPDSAHPEQPIQWRVTDKISEIKVPSNLHAAIASRIDRLTEDSRQALQMASVIGRQFRLTLFQNLAQAEEEVDFWLSQLERGGLIKPEGVGGDLLSDDLLYNFPDTLVQEVAYDSLLVQNRQDLHRRIGEILEKYFTSEAQANGQELEPILLRNCELLAHHFGNSNDHERALKYLEMSAKRARDQNASQTAIETYTHISQIKKSRNDLAGQSNALYSAGTIAYEIGSYDLARKLLSESVKILQEIGDTKSEGWSVLYLGMIELKQANYAESSRYHSRALQLSQARQDTLQEGIHLTNLGRVSMRLGQYDLALEQFQKSLEMKKSMNDATGVGFALFYQGMIYIYRNMLDEAEAALQGAYEAWGAVSASAPAKDNFFLSKNERQISYYYHGAGLLALARRQYKAAEEYLNKALELCNKLELRIEIIENLSALGLARLGQNDNEAALAASNQAIKLLAIHKDVEEAQQIYLNHYQVLKDQNPSLAAESLQRAYETMIERANRLEDEQQRRIYLEQVRVNQDIMAVRQEIQV